jgi:hypothetical protein
MQVRWKTLLTKAIIWIGSELFLNFVGLDNLADYSEYVFTPPHLITPVIMIQG